MPDLHDDLRTYFDELAHRAETQLDPGGDRRRTPARRQGSTRLAIAAVALVALAAITTIAVVAHRSTTSSLATNAPTTSVVPAQWSLTVVPSTGLKDGERVRIHAAGFAPGQMAGIVSCDARNLQPDVGAAACDLETLDSVPADKNGVVDAVYEVRRVIRVNGPYDCLTEPRGCDIAIGPDAQLVYGPPTGIGQRVTFVPGPAEPLPTITLTPSANLRDGQTITVTGTHFKPDTDVWVAECPPRTDCGYQAFGVTAHADSTGSFTQRLILHRTFTVPANLPNGVTHERLDCSTGCLIIAHSDSRTSQLEATLGPITIGKT